MNILLFSPALWMLIIDALVPSTSTSQLNDAGYGTLNIQIKAYAPQNVQCNEIQIPLKGVSSSLTCTSISTPTSRRGSTLEM